MNIFMSPKIVQKHSKTLFTGNIRKIPFSILFATQREMHQHAVLLETDVRRSDFVVFFFNWPKTGQPLILKSILDPLFNGIQEDYLAKV